MLVTKRIEELRSSFVLQQARALSKHPQIETRNGSSKAQGMRSIPGPELCSIDRSQDLRTGGWQRFAKQIAGQPAPRTNTHGARRAPCIKKKNPLQGVWGAASPPTQRKRVKACEASLHSLAHRSRFCEAKARSMDPSLRRRLYPGPEGPSTRGEAPLKKKVGEADPPFQGGLGGLKAPPGATWGPKGPKLAAKPKVSLRDTGGRSPPDPPLGGPSPPQTPQRGA